jgi:hypothetical protein
MNDGIKCFGFDNLKYKCKMSTATSN